MEEFALFVNSSVNEDRLKLLMAISVEKSLFIVSNLDAIFTTSPIALMTFLIITSHITNNQIYSRVSTSSAGDFIDTNIFPIS